MLVDLLMVLQFAPLYCKIIPYFFSFGQLLKNAGFHLLADQWWFLMIEYNNTARI